MSLHPRSKELRDGEPVVDTTSVEDPLRLALLGLSLVAAVGCLVVGSIPEDLARPGPTRLNIYFYLLLRWEPIALGILSVACLATAILLASRRSQERDQNEGDPSRGPATRCDVRRHIPRAVLLVAVLTLLVGFWATFAAHRAYPLSMDEWAAALQAEIFATGRLTAPIPEFWRPYADAATPVFVSLLPDPPRWTSTYLPVYSLLKTPFVWLGVPELLNPLLGALSIVVVALVARRLWPDSAGAPAVAALLLATSSQFLLTSASFYTMPGHLLASLTWMMFHLDPRHHRERMTPFIGALALGMHNFVVHTLFVAPFLFRMLRRRELARLAYYGAIYGVAGAGWFVWLRWAVPRLDSATSGSFALPSLQSLWQQSWNLALFLGWQSLAATCLAGIAMFKLGRGNAFQRDLAWSALLTFAFYFLYTKNQGHGWGYRYVYAVLGNVALLGTSAWVELARTAQRRRLRLLLIASSLVALAIQIPYRLYEVRSTVTPWASASRWLAANDADAIILHPALGWYAQDLVRNEPGLTNRPVLLFMHRMRSTDYEVLRRSREARVLAPEALRAFGIPSQAQRHPP